MFNCPFILDIVASSAMALASRTPLVLIQGESIHQTLQNSVSKTSCTFLHYSFARMFQRQIYQVPRIAPNHQDLHAGQQFNIHITKINAGAFSKRHFSKMILIPKMIIFLYFIYLLITMSHGHNYYEKLTMSILGRQGLNGHTGVPFISGILI